MALSRHAGFFASLQRVEHRLALEDDKPQPTGTTTTTAASPLVFLDHPDAAATAADSSGPALDFLTLTRRDEEGTEVDRAEDDGTDIERLMSLLGLSPPPRDVHGAGCDCSGPDGFMAKVVGVAGPKCDREKGRLDAWIQHYRRPGSDGGCREPARLAHLLIAKASSSSSWDGRAFPATVKEYLDRDAARHPPSDSIADTSLFFE